MIMSISQRKRTNQIACNTNVTEFVYANNDTKKATKLGMIVFRDTQCFNTQIAHMSSVFCPDRQASLMPLS